MHKKFFRKTALFLAAAMFTHSVYAADVSVKIDGKEVDFSAYDNAEPFIENDRVMIPIRAVAEGMGADVWWNGRTREVSVNDNIVLQIDRSTAYINDEPVELDAPAVIIGGRTYIPLRFVSENMGAKVDWDGSERCVSIDMNAAPDTAVSGAAIVETTDASSFFGGAKWDAYAEKYRNDDSVQQLIFVKYTGGSDAEVVMYKKTEDSSHGWTPIVSCSAFVGREGIGEGKLSVPKTPTGDYGVITAFGIKQNPGTTLPYVDVTEDIYCCSDKEYFNTIINAKDLDHECSGEHMSEYVPEYNYGFFFDYNKEGIFDKGSAFFFHCKGEKSSTSGCIAVDETDMARILKRMSAGARLCIDNK